MNLNFDIDLLYQALNMVERLRTMPEITGFSMIGFGILLVLGILNCVLGYRLLRFWMMLFGFLIGALAGFAAAYFYGVQDRMMILAIMAAAGVVLAIIVFVSYKAGIFVLGAGIGLGLGIYFLHPTSSLVFFICLLMGVCLGVMAIKRAREILIIGTSLLGGAMAGLSLARLGGMAEIPYGIGMSAGFALLGMLIQFATNRKKVKEAEDDGYEDPEEMRDSDYVDPIEYIPQRSHKKKEAKPVNVHTTSFDDFDDEEEEYEYEDYEDYLDLDEDAIDAEIYRQMLEEDKRKARIRKKKRALKKEEAKESHQRRKEAKNGKRS